MDSSRFIRIRLIGLSLLLLLSCSGPEQEETTSAERDETALSRTEDNSSTGQDRVSNDQKTSNQDFGPAGQEAGLFVEGETFFYKTDGIPAPTLAIDMNGRERKITHENGGPTEPAVSPDRTKMAFVMPTGFEIPGEVFVLRAEDLTLETVVPLRDMPPNHSARKVVWYDTRHLVVIVGFTYGTVSVGGDVYMYDTVRDAFFPVYREEAPSREVKEARVEDGELHLQIAVFNSDYTGYVLKRKVLPADRISELIRE